MLVKRVVGVYIVVIIAFWSHTFRVREYLFCLSQEAVVVQVVSLRAPSAHGIKL
jgi:hypothetical protein